MIGLNFNLFTTYSKHINRHQVLVIKNTYIYSTNSICKYSSHTHLSTSSAGRYQYIDQYLSNGNIEPLNRNIRLTNSYLPDSAQDGRGREDEKEERSAKHDDGKCDGESDERFDNEEIE